jgi:hypothetical protein
LAIWFLDVKNLISPSLGSNAARINSLISSPKSFHYRRI